MFPSLYIPGETLLNDLPAVSVVKTGTTFGPFAGDAGTLTLPTQDQVLNGVAYGVAGTGSTGDVVLPSTGNVRNTVTFGPSSGLTGTYDPITGNYTDPGVAHVQSGQTYKFAGTTETGTYDPVTGNYTDPGTTNVRSGTTYKFAGSTETGSYSGGSGGSVGDQQLAKVIYGIAATVRFVSPSGNDTTGDGLTWSTAYATPTKAATVAVAGDLILLGGMFDLGPSGQFAPAAGVNVRGFGPGAGITGSIASGLGPYLCQISGDSDWEDFAIVGNAPSGEYQLPLLVASGANAVIRNVPITGQTDCIYFDHASAATLRAYDCPLYSNWDVAFVDTCTDCVLELHDCPMVSLGPPAGFTATTPFSTGVCCFQSADSHIRVYDGSVSASGNTIQQMAVRTYQGNVWLYGTSVATFGAAPTQDDLNQGSTGAIYVAGAKYNPGKTSGTITQLNDKSGYSLAATGLDAISAADPTGAPGTWNFRQKLLWVFRRLARSTYDSNAGTLKTYDGTGTQISTQTASNSGGVQSTGELS